jgi:hypothetical protein
MPTATKISEVRDLLFDDYNIRQKDAVSLENLDKQSAQLKVSDTFVHSKGKWRVSNYEGFAVLSMVKSNPGNDQCFNKLKQLRDVLEFQLQNSSYFWLHEDSYHQTIANTLSSDRYIENVKIQGLGKEYPAIIGKAFSQISMSGYDTPIKLKMIGCNVFGSCIALLGTFANEQDYYRIMQFRDQFYHNLSLNNLNIRRTRPFVGHITFAYLGRDLSTIERKHLASTLNRINSQIQNWNIEFNISQAGLMYYKDLSSFYRELNYPVFSFVDET